METKPIGSCPKGPTLSSATFSADDESGELSESSNSERSPPPTLYTMAMSEGEPRPKTSTRMWQRHVLKREVAWSAESDSMPLRMRKVLIADNNEAAGCFERDRRSRIGISDESSNHGWFVGSLFSCYCQSQTPKLRTYPKHPAPIWSERMIHTERREIDALPRWLSEPSPFRVLRLGVFILYCR